jgi:hypothetical protein
MAVTSTAMTAATSFSRLVSMAADAFNRDRLFTRDARVYVASPTLGA